MKKVFSNRLFCKLGLLISTYVLSQTDLRAFVADQHFFECKGTNLAALWPVEGEFSLQQILDDPETPIVQDIKDLNLNVNQDQLKPLYNTPSWNEEAENPKEAFPKRPSVFFAVDSLHTPEKLPEEAPKQAPNTIHPAPHSAKFFAISELSEHNEKPLTAQKIHIKTDDISSGAPISDDGLPVIKLASEPIPKSISRKIETHEHKATAHDVAWPHPPSWEKEVKNGMQASQKKGLDPAEASPQYKKPEISLGVINDVQVEPEKLPVEGKYQAIKLDPPPKPRQESTSKAIMGLGSSKRELPNVSQALPVKNQSKAPISKKLKPTFDYKEVGAHLSSSPLQDLPDTALTHDSLDMFPASQGKLDLAPPPHQLPEINVTENIPSLELPTIIEGNKEGPRHITALPEKSLLPQPKGSKPAKEIMPPNTHPEYFPTVKAGPNKVKDKPVVQRKIPTIGHSLDSIPEQASLPEKETLESASQPNAKSEVHYLSPIQSEAETDAYSPQSIHENFPVIKKSIKSQPGKGQLDRTMPQIGKNLETLPEGPEISIDHKIERPHTPSAFSEGYKPVKLKPGLHANADQDLQEPFPTPEHQSLQHQAKIQRTVPHLGSKKELAPPKPEMAIEDAENTRQHPTYATEKHVLEQKAGFPSSPHSYKPTKEDLPQAKDVKKLWHTSTAKHTLPKAGEHHLDVPHGPELILEADGYRETLQEPNYEKNLLSPLSERTDLPSTHEAHENFPAIDANKKTFIRSSEITYPTSKLGQKDSSYAFPEISFEDNETINPTTLKSGEERHPITSGSPYPGLEEVSSKNGSFPTIQSNPKAIEKATGLHNIPSIGRTTEQIPELPEIAIEHGDGLIPSKLPKGEVRGISNSVSAYTESSHSGEQGVDSSFYKENSKGTSKQSLYSLPNIGKQQGEFDLPEIVLEEGSIDNTAHKMPSNELRKITQPSNQERVPEIQPGDVSFPKISSKLKSDETRAQSSHQVPKVGLQNEFNEQPWISAESETQLKTLNAKEERRYLFSQKEDRVFHDVSSSEEFPTINSSKGTKAEAPKHQLPKAGTTHHSLIETWLAGEDNNEDSSKLTPTQEKRHLPYKHENAPISEVSTQTDFPKASYKHSVPTHEKTTHSIPKIEIKQGDVPDPWLAPEERTKEEGYNPALQRKQLSKTTAKNDLDDFRSHEEKFPEIKTGTPKLSSSLSHQVPDLGRKNETDQTLPHPTLEDRLKLANFPLANEELRQLKPANIASDIEHQQINNFDALPHPYVDTKTYQPEKLPHAKPHFGRINDMPDIQLGQEKSGTNTVSIPSPNKEKRVLSQSNAFSTDLPESASAQENFPTIETGNLKHKSTLEIPHSVPSIGSKEQKISIPEPKSLSSSKPGFEDHQQSRQLGKEKSSNATASWPVPNKEKRVLSQSNAFSTDLPESASAQENFPTIETGNLKHKSTLEIPHSVPSIGSKEQKISIPESKSLPSSKPGIEDHQQSRQPGKEKSSNATASWPVPNKEKRILSQPNSPSVGLPEGLSENENFPTIETGNLKHKSTLEIPHSVPSIGTKEHSISIPAKPGSSHVGDMTSQQASEQNNPSNKRSEPTPHRETRMLSQPTGFSGGLPEGQGGNEKFPSIEGKTYKVKKTQEIPHSVPSIGTKERSLTVPNIEKSFDTNEKAKLHYSYEKQSLSKPQSFSEEIPEPTTNSETFPSVDINSKQFDKEKLPSYRNPKNIPANPKEVGLLDPMQNIEIEGNNNPKTTASPGLEHRRVSKNKLSIDEFSEPYSTPESFPSIEIEKKAKEKNSFSKTPPSDRFSKKTIDDPKVTIEPSINQTKALLPSTEQKLHNIPTVELEKNTTKTQLDIDEYRQGSKKESVQRPIPQLSGSSHAPSNLEPQNTKQRYQETLKSTLPANEHRKLEKESVDATSFTQEGHSNGIAPQSNEEVKNNTVSGKKEFQKLGSLEREQNAFVEPNTLPHHGKSGKLAQDAMEKQPYPVKPASKVYQSNKSIDVPEYSSEVEPFPEIKTTPYQLQAPGKSKAKTPTRSKNEAEKELKQPLYTHDNIEELAQRDLPASSTENKTGSNKKILINFNNVGIIEYIRFISRITNKNFVFDEADLQFNVTIVSEEPTSVENIMTALIQELRIHDLTLIQQGNNLIIHKNPKVNSISQVVSDEVPDLKDINAEIVTQVFRLNSLDPEKAAAIIRPLVSEKALIEYIKETNHLIVTDVVSNVEQIGKLLKNIDAPNSGLVIGQYVARVENVDTLLPLVKQIMAPISQEQPLSFVPYENSNSIFIVSSPFLVERSISILQHLDQEKGKTRIIDLKELKFDQGGRPTGPSINNKMTQEKRSGSMIPTHSEGLSAGETWYKTREGGWEYGPPRPEMADRIQKGELEGLSIYPMFIPVEVPVKVEVPVRVEVPVPVPAVETEEEKEAKERAKNIPIPLRVGITEFKKEEVIPTEKISRKVTQNEEYIAKPINKSKFYIHKLQYRKGDAVLAQIQQIGNSLANTKGNEDLIAAISTINWLEDTKSLVFTGTPENLERIKELVEQVDIPLRQVFIEMLILNTTVDESLNYGVNWGQRFGGGDTAGSQGFLAGASPIQGVLDQTGVTDLGTPRPNTTTTTTTTEPFNQAIIPDPGPLAKSTGFNLGIIGQHIIHKGLGLEFNSIAALVSAIHTRNQNNIVMSPKIITEDGVPAYIFVGVNTPFQTQSIANNQGSIVTNNFDFKDVGTSLQVTPHLGNSDIVTLEVLQEVSSISNANTGGGNTNVNIGPTTNKNTTKTTVHIPDGFFVIISGMIQDEQERDRTQVPCLGGVPILGAGFSNKSTIDRKRNLMIFIRPQIIDTDEQIQNITRHEQDVWKFKSLLKKNWLYETEEALDFFNIRRTQNTDDQDDPDCKQFAH